MNEQIHDAVRDRYAQSALRVMQHEAAWRDEPGTGAQMYSAAERDALPDAAVLEGLDLAVAVVESSSPGWWPQLGSSWPSRRLQFSPPVDTSCR